MATLQNFSIAKHAKSLKISLNRICSAVTKILNLSLLTGLYPKHFKVAIVIPVHKTGCKHAEVIIGPYQFCKFYLKSLKEIQADISNIPHPNKKKRFW